MNKSLHRIGWVLLSLPLFAHAGEKIAVNPSQLLLQGGLEHANRAFQAKTGIDVVMPEKAKGCGGTVLGLKTGKIDAGIMCCPPTREDLGKGDLVPARVARDGIVFSVHASNPVASLTTQQVRDIFQGRITNWQEVGGKDAPITPYAFVMCPQRVDAWRQLVVGEHDPKPGVLTIDNGLLAKSFKRIKGGPNVAKAVARDPNGIGLTSTAYHAFDGTKLIALDGVMPTAQSVADESYLAVRPLYMVTKGYPAGAIRQYVDFLRSEKGQALLAREGRLARM